MLICIILLFINSWAFPQEFPNSDVHIALEIGIEYILNQNYEMASKKFSSLSQQHPELPLGKIYCAVVELIRAYDYGEEIDPQIEKKFDEAIEQSDSLLNKNSADKWNLYFMALAKGYKTYYKILKDEWLSAVPTGFSAVGYFNDCLEIDSSFYEAYFAVGAYKFWKSRKLEFLEWLPFIKDESKEGITYIETALTKSIYNRNIAALSLIWIYIEQKKFNKAIEIAEMELKKNPINRTLLWALARSYEDVNIKKSIEIYKSILNSYRQIPNQNHFQEITLMHIIAQQYLKIGEKREAARICDEILLQKSISEEVRLRLSDRLKKVKKMKQELSD